MRLFLFFLLLNDLQAFASNLDGHYFQNGCTIYQKTGEQLLEIPGDYCLLLDDGTYVSATYSTVRFHGPDMSLRWSLELPVHHQINLSEDGKSILVLSSAYVSKGKAKYRDDRFVRVSLDGKILQDQTIADLLSEEKLIRWNTKHGAGLYPEYTTERSHFNSIYEIPDVPERKDAPWLRRGNIIVNSLQVGTLVLAPDFSKVLHHFTYPHSLEHRIHDVRVLPSGSLLLFNNITTSTKETLYVSSVDLVDPVTFKHDFVFGGNTGMYFYSGARCGVQPLGPDLLVISLEWQGVYVVSKKSGKIVLTNHKVNTGRRGLQPSQEVRLLKLDGFLKHFTGPVKF